MSFVVAFRVPHNEGLIAGIITGPEFDTGTDLVDLYEVDATIKSFATEDEARAWLLGDEELAEFEELDLEPVSGGFLAKQGD
jgi:hypothetical protein